MVDLEALVALVKTAPGLLGKRDLELITRLDAELDGDDGALIAHGDGFFVTCGEAISPPFLKADPDEAPWIGLARHRDRAAEAAEALGETLELLERAEPLELAAFQLAVAERRLAAITGVDALGPVGEEVLARIFARFCIGK